MKKIIVHNNSKPVNVEVELRDGETTERLIKRFIKKTKKDEVLKIYMRSRWFTKPSVIRRKKKKEKLRISRETTKLYHSNIRE